MQLHLHAALKENGTRRTGHRRDLTRPWGINPSAFAGSLVKTVREGEEMLVPRLFLSSSLHLASPLCGDRAEGFNGH